MWAFAVFFGQGKSIRTSANWASCLVPGVKRTQQKNGLVVRCTAVEQKHIGNPQPHNLLTLDMAGDLYICLHPVEDFFSGHWRSWLQCCDHTSGVMDVICVEVGYYVMTLILLPWFYSFQWLTSKKRKSFQDYWMYELLDWVNLKNSTTFASPLLVPNRGSGHGRYLQAELQPAAAQDLQQLKRAPNHIVLLLIFLVLLKRLLVPSSLKLFLISCCYSHMFMFRQPSKQSTLNPGLYIWQKLEGALDVLCDAIPRAAARFCALTTSCKSTTQYYLMQYDEICISALSLNAMKE